MPACCSVNKCGMRANRDAVSFYRIPAALQNSGYKLNSLSKERREQWIKALKKEKSTESQIKHARICSRHFITGAPAQLVDNDHPDWVPTQNMGYCNPNRPTKVDIERYERAKKRKETKEEQEPTSQMSNAGEYLLNDDDIVIEVFSEADEISEPQVGEHVSSKAVQTDLTGSILRKLIKDLNKSNARIYKLENKLKQSEGHTDHNYFVKDKE